MADLRQLLVDVGLQSWPLPAGSAVHPTDVIKAALRLYGLAALATVSVAQDMLDASRPCIYVGITFLLAATGLSCLHSASCVHQPRTNTSGHLDNRANSLQERSIYLSRWCTHEVRPFLFFVVGFLS